MATQFLTRDGLRGMCLEVARLAANAFVSLVVGVDSCDVSAAVVRCTSTPLPSPGASRRASIGRLARPVSAAAVFGRR